MKFIRTIPAIAILAIGLLLAGCAGIGKPLEPPRVSLADIRVDYGFIGTGYVDALHGLTEFDWDVVQVKKAVIEASRKVVLLCISEKLNSQHRYRTCDISAINTLVTELPPDHNRLNSFRQHQIHIL